MNGTILYSGALAQVPHNGGLAWLHLQFLLGFRRLGYNVIFLDRLDGGMCVDDRGEQCTFEASINRRWFLGVMRVFGLEECFSLDFHRGEEILGLSRAKVLEQAKSTLFLLNVMGYMYDAAILERIPTRVFLDIDPGFPQMWRALGLHDAFAGHTHFATLGLNIGRRDCMIPTCGLDWITLKQPVVLEQWLVQPPRPQGAFTSIGAWRGPNGPITFDGCTYGLRVHEFRNFFELPQRCPGERFEQALEIHANETADLDRLNANCWTLVSPGAVAGSPRQYRQYLSQSKAEFMVPKQMYVQTRSGLLSDRSAYYLATGRPVLARDTGLGDHFPLGSGLISFATIDEAAAGVAEISANYDYHCRAAREIAETHFDSDRVLTDFIAKVIA